MAASLDRSEGPNAEPRSRAGVWVFRAVSVLLFAILTGQLWRLQIVDGRSYAGRSAANYLRTAAIAPQRGVIFDRNRTLLASNAPTFVVSITPADVPKGRLEEIVIRLANELRVPPTDLQRVVDRWKGRPDYSVFTPIPVRYDVDREAIYRISERSSEMPGVQVSVDSVRRYTDGAPTSSLLGYMGPIAPEDAKKRESQGYSPEDRVGAVGLEAAYEDDLRGTPGKRLYQVDVTGQEVTEIRREAAKPGNSLVLTLDLELQRDVQRILLEGLGNYPSGAAIVSDPRTGEILAMVSTPTFDNNVIGDVTRQDELQALLQDDKMLPMFPRAYGGTYAPGSVFKLVTGSAALQEGVATRDTIIDSKGVMYVASEEYPGVSQAFNDNAAWGKQNFLQGLANSSNIYFFWLGGGYQEGDVTIFKGLGVDRLAKYARAFGYGAPTGIDLPGEKRGIVPDEQWKMDNKNERWFKGDTYNMSIGQGDVLVTPLQVANATNAIANGGTLYEPRLGKYELNSDGQVVRTIQSQGRPVGVDPNNLALMREAMEFAFAGPHLKAFAIPGLRAAGKTGTAEYPGPLDAQGNLPTHGWFTGFAPANDPVVTVTVFVDRGGGSQASPIGARIMRRFFRLPDAPATPQPNPAPLPPAAPRQAP
ncbi:MAG: penicillin-binding protein 2 [Chloroflexi bacterium]|nr:penicillin-binding protein 2 [Chloroflexota bacterium]